MVGGSQNNGRGDGGTLPPLKQKPTTKSSKQSSLFISPALIILSHFRFFLLKKKDPTSIPTAKKILPF
jgi:hypothetical protein